MSPGDDIWLGWATASVAGMALKETAVERWAPTTASDGGKYGSAMATVCSTVESVTETRDGTWPPATASCVGRPRPATVSWHGRRNWTQTAATPGYACPPPATASCGQRTLVTFCDDPTAMAAAAVAMTSDAAAAEICDRVRPSLWIAVGSRALCRICHRRQ